MMSLVIKEKGVREKYLCMGLPDRKRVCKRVSGAV